MDTTASAVQQRSALLALQPVAVASALPAPISKDDESDDESEDDESEEEARRAGAKRRRHACLDPDWGHSIKQRINISIKTMLSAAAAPSGESAPPKAKKQRQHKYAKRKSRRAGAPTWPESRGSVVLNMLAAMLYSAAFFHDRQRKLDACWREWRSVTNPEVLGRGALAERWNVPITALNASIEANRAATARTLYPPETSELQKQRYRRRLSPVPREWQLVAVASALPAPTDRQKYSSEDDESEEEARRAGAKKAQTRVCAVHAAATATPFRKRRRVASSSSSSSSASASAPAASAANDASSEDAETFIDGPRYFRDPARPGIISCRI